jgi:hypothetical protein
MSSCLPADIQTKYEQFMSADIQNRYEQFLPEDIQTKYEQLPSADIQTKYEQLLQISKPNMSSSCRYPNQIGAVPADIQTK